GKFILYCTDSTGRVQYNLCFLCLPGFTVAKIDDLAKSLFERHPGESRGPEHLEITGFRLSPE
ncbi:MAG: hypothetical protein NTV04_21500, partial [Deltaproteobacteria bacterium]|nr:hypothetical protein [Deltaproteobacteria bacterium]